VRKSLRILLAGLGLIILGGMFWEILHPSEPRYAGQTLGKWLYQYNQFYLEEFVKTNASPEEARAIHESQNRCRFAVLQIGTNGIPKLLDMVQAKNSPLVKMLKIIAKSMLIKNNIYSEEDYHAMASEGFFFLGVTGREAVPALVDLLKPKIFPFDSLLPIVWETLVPRQKRPFPYFSRILMIRTGSSNGTRWSIWVGFTRIPSWLFQF